MLIKAERPGPNIRCFTFNSYGATIKKKAEILEPARLREAEARERLK